MAAVATWARAHVLRSGPPYLQFFTFSTYWEEFGLELVFPFVVCFPLLVDLRGLITYAGVDEVSGGQNKPEAVRRSETWRLTFFAISCTVETKAAFLPRDLLNGAFVRQADATLTHEIRLFPGVCVV